MSLGFTLLQAGQPEPAEGEFRAYLQRFPESVLGYSNLAQAEFPVGRYAEAQQALDKALLLNPDSPQAHLTLGMMRYRQGKYEEAAEQFRKTLGTIPQHYGAHVGLGFCLLELGQNARAEWEFSQANAIDILSHEPQARMGIAFLHYLQGQVDQARRMYDEALNISPPFRERAYTERYIKLWMPADGKATGAWRALLDARTV